VFDRSGVN